VIFQFELVFGDFFKIPPICWVLGGIAEK